MHQKQLSLEESWQLSVFSQHNKNGKQGAGLGKQSEERGEGLSHGDWESTGGTGPLKEETEVLVHALTHRPHTINTIKTYHRN